MANRETVWRIESALGDARHWAGVGFGPRSGRLKLALVRGCGAGWNTRILAAEALTLPPPEWESGTLVDIIDARVRELCEQSEIAIDEVETLGLDGVPNRERAAPLAVDIAERTGITVVSDCALRDRAAGGRGRPLSVALDWLLWRSPRVNRLLVHLSSAVEVAYLPAGIAEPRVVPFDAVPCADFLDRFARALSQDTFPFDPGGHFAVQGRPHEPLIESWISHPYLLRPPPKTLTDADFSDSLCQDSLAFARERRLSAADVLCSANHFVARAAREAVNRWLPVGARIDEIWVSGGGVRNGLLWKLMREGFAPTPFARCDDAGLPGEARPALHAALLAFLTMEHLPGNVPSATGAKAERVLGQITPGSRQNWDRWVCNVADRLAEPQLRAA